MKKRQINKTIYINDLEDGINEMFEVEDKEMDDIKEDIVVYWKKQNIMRTFNTKLDRKIATEIIKCIKNPHLYESNWNSYIKDIADKSGANPCNVRSVLERMKQVYSLPKMEVIV